MCKYAMTSDNQEQEKKEKKEQCHQRSRLDGILLGMYAYLDERI